MGDLLVSLITTVAAVPLDSAAPAPRLSVKDLDP